jgi:hypothetical protein
VYNPLKLPLGWDGKPIPYWLYKLHGLNMEFKCEICGNYRCEAGASWARPRWWGASVRRGVRAVLPRAREVTSGVLPRAARVHRSSCWGRRASSTRRGTHHTHTHTLAVAHHHTNAHATKPPTATGAGARLSATSRSGGTPTA